MLEEATEVWLMVLGWKRIHHTVDGQLDPVAGWSQGQRGRLSTGILIEGHCRSRDTGILMEGHCRSRDIGSSWKDTVRSRDTESPSPFTWWCYYRRQQNHISLQDFMSLCFFSTLPRELLSLFLFFSLP